MNPSRGQCFRDAALYKFANAEMEDLGTAGELSPGEVGAIQHPGPEGFSRLKKSRLPKEKRWRSPPYGIAGQTKECWTIPNGQLLLQANAWIGAHRKCPPGWYHAGCGIDAALG